MRTKILIDAADFTHSLTPSGYPVWVQAHDAADLLEPTVLSGHYCASAKDDGFS